MSSFWPSGWKWNKMSTINWELKDEDLWPGTARDEPSFCTSSGWGVRKQAASYFKVGVTQEGGWHWSDLAECWMDEQRNEEQKKETRDRQRCYREIEQKEREETQRNTLFNVQSSPLKEGQGLGLSQSPLGPQHWAAPCAEISVCDPSLLAWSLPQMPTMCPRWTRSNYLRVPSRFF